MPFQNCLAIESFAGRVPPHRAGACREYLHDPQPFRFPLISLIRIRGTILMRSFIVSSVFALVVVVQYSSAACAGSCVCWDGFWNTKYCTNGWKPDPGRTLVYYTYSRTATDAKSIGSCVAAGDVPPQKICSASVAGTKVKSATLTGDLKISNFGFQGTLGEELTVRQSCGGTVSIKSWCSCCKVRARVKFRNTRKCGTCACSTCEDYKCGTLVEYVGVVCDEGDPECTVPTDCVNECPPSA